MYVLLQNSTYVLQNTSFSIEPTIGCVPLNQLCASRLKAIIFLKYQDVFLHLQTIDSEWAEIGNNH